MTLVINALQTQQADLFFGQAQVEQFIVDRPGTGEIIDREPALRELLIACFAGTFNGQRVFWNCRDPDIELPALQTPPYLSYPPLVQVSKDASTSSVDKCTLLLFELQNARSDDRWESLARMARKRQIGREDYARSCLRYEFQTARKVQEFFRQHPIALTDDESNPYYRGYLNMSDDFPAYLGSLRDEKGEGFNHWNYYLRNYDEMMTDKRN